VFRKLQNETHGLQERLTALQRDADNIAMVSRIVSAEEQVSDVHARLGRLAAAQQSIDHRAAQIKTRPQPLNAQKREAELVGQLGELSQALSAAETQALTRLKGAKGALQEKLALIEETRDQHIGLLEEDLARLQSGR
jgi:chromosome segregation ATPase